MKEKSTLPAFLTVLIIFGLLSINITTVSADTPVSGIISADTSWTQANGPYTLNGNLLVNNGVTLTIQAGTTVNLGSYYIQVNGALNARGSEINQIFFNGGQITFTSSSSNWNEQSNSGSIIENSSLSSTAIISQNSPMLNNNTFKYVGIRVDGLSTNFNVPVSPMIYNNTFYSCGVNVGVYGFPFTGWTQPIISNNTFIGGGIVLGDLAPQGNISALILDNIIYGASTGILLQSTGGSGVQIIQGNLIMSNNEGLQIRTSCIIKNNTITKNSIGISALGTIDPVTLGNIHGYTPVIFYNNINANNNYNIKMIQGNGNYQLNINATYNWWGTTDTQAISPSIYDFNQDFKFGIVTYIPILISPNPAVPIYINASAGTGGSITSSGITRLNFGSSQTFTIAASSGYHIADVTVNETSVGALNSYTVQNIQGATAISATFAADPTPTPTLSPTPTAAPTAAPTSAPTSTPTSAPTQTPIESPSTSPSPTPVTPEFPFFIALVIMLIAATTALLFNNKNHKK